jgi:hypothetical protein
MLKKTLLALALVSSVAHADNEMAYISNNAGGNIFFTFSECVYLDSGKRIPNKFYVYSTNKGGSRGADGCYEYRHPFYIIQWNSGNRTSVNVNDVSLIDIRR